MVAKPIRVVFAVVTAVFPIVNLLWMTPSDGEHAGRLASRTGRLTACCTVLVLSGTSAAVVFSCGVVPTWGSSDFMSHIPFVIGVITMIITWMGDLTAPAGWKKANAMVTIGYSASTLAVALAGIWYFKEHYYPAPAFIFSGAEELVATGVFVLAVLVQVPLGIIHRLPSRVPVGGGDCEQGKKFA